jgi:hypothetical protein
MNLSFLEAIVPIQEAEVVVAVVVQQDALDAAQSAVTGVVALAGPELHVEDVFALMLHNPII